MSWPKLKTETQIEVLDQIRSASKDVQYIRTMPTTETGTIPLVDGAQAVESTKHWILSAAVSVAGGRSYAVEPRRKPTQALDFLRGVRLGATYPGSFVISIQIPVPPELPSRYLDLDHPAFSARRDPYERLVSLRLRDASSAAFAAASRVLASDGNFDSFVQVIPKGVSANFCESLAGLGGEGGYPFSVDFRWAVSRPVEHGDQLEFSPGHIRVLREAARILRETAPEEDVHLIGNVVRLHREGNLGSGEISILGFIEGDAQEKLVRVWLTLDESNYRLATVAHEQGATVSVRGTLIRHGNRSSMQGSHTFDVVPELPI